MTLDEEAETHPQPSPAEALQAEFGDRFQISRDLLPGGSHGDWVARPWPSSDDRHVDPDQEFRAPSISDLRDLLARHTGDDRFDEGR
jgi:hypothetical protein